MIMYCDLSQFSYTELKMPPFVAIVQTISKETEALISGNS